MILRIATVYKTLSKKILANRFQGGFTYMELTVVLVILLIILTLITVLVNPIGKIKEARDKTRLSNIMTIDRAVNEFLLDNKRYPDQLDVLRTSNTLPSGSIDLTRSNLGWIYDDLSRYTPNLPIDPVNDSVYYYSYIHNDTGYEINAILESQFDLMSDDGGNDANSYEVGNNLNLISP